MSSSERHKEATLPTHQPQVLHRQTSRRQAAFASEDRPLQLPRQAKQASIGARRALARSSVSSITLSQKQDGHAAPVGSTLNQPVCSHSGDLVVVARDQSEPFKTPKTEQESRTEHKDTAQQALQLPTSEGDNNESKEKKSKSSQVQAARLRHLQKKMKPQFVVSQKAHESHARFGDSIVPRHLDFKTSQEHATANESLWTLPYDSRTANNNLACNGIKKLRASRLHQSQATVQAAPPQQVHLRGSEPSSARHNGSQLCHPHGETSEKIREVAKRASVAQQTRSSRILPIHEAEVPACDLQAGKVVRTQQSLHAISGRLLFKRQERQEQTAFIRKHAPACADPNDSQNALAAAHEREQHSQGSDAERPSTFKQVQARSKAKVHFDETMVQLGDNSGSFSSQNQACVSSPAGIAVDMSRVRSLPCRTEPLNSPQSPMEDHSAGILSSNEHQGAGIVEAKLSYSSLEESKGQQDISSRNRRQATRSKALRVLRAGDFVSKRAKGHNLVSADQSRGDLASQRSLSGQRQVQKIKFVGKKQPQIGNSRGSNRQGESQSLFAGSKNNQLSQRLTVRMSSVQTSAEMNIREENSALSNQPQNQGPRDGDNLIAAQSQSNMSVRPHGSQKLVESRTLPRQASQLNVLRSLKDRDVYQHAAHSDTKDEQPSASLSSLRSSRHIPSNIHHGRGNASHKHSNSVLPSQRQLHLLSSMNQASEQHSPKNASQLQHYSQQSKDLLCQRREPFASIGYVAEDEQQHSGTQTKLKHLPRYASNELHAESTAPLGHHVIPKLNQASAGGATGLPQQTLPANSNVLVNKVQQKNQQFKFQFHRKSHHQRQTKYTLNNGKTGQVISARLANQHTEQQAPSQEATSRQQIAKLEEPQSLASQRNSFAKENLPNSAIQGSFNARTSRKHTKRQLTAVQGDSADGSQIRNEKLLFSTNESPLEAERRGLSQRQSVQLTARHEASELEGVVQRASRARLQSVAVQKGQDQPKKTAEQVISSSNQSGGNISGLTLANAQRPPNTPLKQSISSIQPNSSLTGGEATTTTCSAMRRSHVYDAKESRKASKAEARQQEGSTAQVTVQVLHCGSSQDGSASDNQAQQSLPSIKTRNVPLFVSKKSNQVPLLKSDFNSSSSPTFKPKKVASKMPKLIRHQRATTKTHQMLDSNSLSSQAEQASKKTSFRRNQSIESGTYQNSSQHTPVSGPHNYETSSGRAAQPCSAEGISDVEGAHMVTSDAAYLNVYTDHMVETNTMSSAARQSTAEQNVAEISRLRAQIRQRDLAYSNLKSQFEQLQTQIKTNRLDSVPKEQQASLPGLASEMSSNPGDVGSLLLNKQRSNSEAQLQLMSAFLTKKRDQATDQEPLGRSPAQQITEKQSKLRQPTKFPKPAQTERRLTLPEARGSDKTAKQPQRIAQLMHKKASQFQKKSSEAASPSKPRIPEISPLKGRSTRQSAKSLPKARKADIQRKQHTIQTARDSNNITSFQQNDRDSAVGGLTGPPNQHVKNKTGVTRAPSVVSLGCGSKLSSSSKRAQEVVPCLSQANLAAQKGDQIRRIRKVKHAHHQSLSSIDALPAGLSSHGNKIAVQNLQHVISSTGKKLNIRKGTTTHKSAVMMREALGSDATTLQASQKGGDLGSDSKALHVAQQDSFGPLQGEQPVKFTCAASRQISIGDDEAVGEKIERQESLFKNETPSNEQSHGSLNHPLPKKASGALQVAPRPEQSNDFKTTGTAFGTKPGAALPQEAHLKNCFAPLQIKTDARAPQTRMSQASQKSACFAKPSHKDSSSNVPLSSRRSDVCAGEESRCNTPIHPNQVVDGIKFFDVQDPTYKSSEVFERCHEDEQPQNHMNPNKAGTPLLGMNSTGKQFFAVKQAARQNESKSQLQQACYAEANQKQSIQILKQLQKKKQGKTRKVAISQNNPFFQLQAKPTPQPEASLNSSSMHDGQGSRPKPEFLQQRPSALEIHSRNLAVQRLVPSQVPSQSGGPTQAEIKKTLSVSKKQDSMPRSKAGTNNQSLVSQEVFYSPAKPQDQSSQSESDQLIITADGQQLKVANQRYAKEAIEILPQFSHRSRQAKRGHDAQLSQVFGDSLLQVSQIEHVKRDEILDDSLIAALNIEPRGPMVADEESNADLPAREDFFLERQMSRLPQILDSPGHSNFDSTQGAPCATNAKSNFADLIPSTEKVGQGLFAGEDFGAQAQFGLDASPGFKKQRLDQTLLKKELHLLEAVRGLESAHVAKTDQKALNEAGHVNQQHAMSIKMGSGGGTVVSGSRYSLTDIHGNLTYSESSQAHI